MIVLSPSIDYDISKIIFAGKEHYAKFIIKTKDAWNNDIVYNLLKINQPTDIYSNFL